MNFHNLSTSNDRQTITSVEDADAMYLAVVHRTGERSSTKSSAEILDTPLQGSRNRGEECAARVPLLRETLSTFTGSMEKKAPGCRVSWVHKTAGWPEMNLKHCAL